MPVGAAGCRLVDTRTQKLTALLSQWVQNSVLLRDITQQSLAHAFLSF